MVSQIQLLHTMFAEKNHHYHIIYNSCSNNLGSTLRTLSLKHETASGLLRYMLKVGTLNYHELTKHTTRDA